MRFQYTTKTLLLAMAVVDITWAPLLCFYRYVVPNYGGVWRATRYYLMDTFIWSPAIFVAFAIGRRALTVWMVVFFAVVEAISTAYFYWVINYFQ